MLDSDRRGLEAFIALADSLDELVFVWKTNGDMLWTNRAFVHETGLTVADFGFPNKDNPFVHPEDLARVLAELGAFIDSDAVRSAPLENRFFDAWGRVRPLSSILHKINWQGEPALLLVSTLTTRAGMSETEASYRKLVESADDGILKLATAGRVVYSNRRFHEMCRLTMVQLAKKCLPELVLADDRAATERALERLRANETRVSFEARLPRDGELLWLEINVCPLDDAGTAVFLAIARDVSHTRRLEDKMRQAQKLESLGTLAGGIAHDFNNIVTSVLANATLAETMLEGGPALAEVVHDIRVAAERAASLNASLLAYVGQAPTTLETLDLHDCVRAAVRMLRPLIDRAVRIDLPPAGEPPLVRADPGQLSQIMVNVITNAAQAMPEGGGIVQVETGVAHYLGATDRAWLPTAPPPGRYAFLRVTDDGVGMTADVIDRMFDPFFSTKGPGRGLGLSATLGIVKRHGGALCIDSEPGRGTRFEVVLPLAEPRREEKRAAPGPTAPQTTTQPGVVLFCDDEPLIRQLGKRILEREGYEVVLASTGEQALEELSAARERFSVLVVDHSLPGLRGDKVAL
ncbi:MAG TPA: ATP-binding protein, partial [Polyangiaceae bacterium]|nr:ATP-binding protein [Polyangiaceae bacterium]